MTGPIQCQHCRHFLRDASNPTAAMGRCYADARHGYWFPGEIHRCMDFDDTPDVKKLEPDDGE